MEAVADHVGGVPDFLKGMGDRVERGPGDLGKGVTVFSEGGADLATRRGLYVNAVADYVVKVAGGVNVVGNRVVVVVDAVAVVGDDLDGVKKHARTMLIEASAPFSGPRYDITSSRTCRLIDVAHPSYAAQRAVSGVLLPFRADEDECNEKKLFGWDDWHCRGRHLGQRGLLEWEGWHLVQRGRRGWGPGGRLHRWHELSDQQR